jgi:hypothetical protein
MTTEARNSDFAAREQMVRIHVPRVAQLAHISSPKLGSVEAAQRESHTFRNRRGHGSLPTRAIILSKGGRFQPDRENETMLDWLRVRFPIWVQTL